MADRDSRWKRAGVVALALGAGLTGALVYSTSMARANNPIVLREAMAHCSRLKVGDDVAAVRDLGQRTGAQVREIDHRIELRYRRPFSDRLGCVAHVENGKVSRTYFEDFPPEFPGEFQLP